MSTKIRRSFPMCPVRPHNRVYPQHLILHRVVSGFVGGNRHVGVLFPKRRANVEPGKRKPGALPTRKAVYTLPRRTPVASIRGWRTGPGTRSGEIPRAASARTSASKAPRFTAGFRGDCRGCGTPSIPASGKASRSRRPIWFPGKPTGSFLLPTALRNSGTPEAYSTGSCFAGIPKRASSASRTTRSAKTGCDASRSGGDAPRAFAQLRLQREDQVL